MNSELKNTNKKKNILLWVLAVIITLGAAVYQKITGPTYPKKEKVTLNGKEHKLKFIRSWGEGENVDGEVKLNIDDKNISAKLFYKHFPSKEGEKWVEQDFVGKQNNEESYIVAKLPYQPPAGKLMYYVQLNSNEGNKTLFKDKPIVIRFKGFVPSFVLIPHIIFMFLAMLLANSAGLFAVFKLPQFKTYTTITLILMLIGGMILGPIVQKYAFDEFWAGVPFGWDLTDNKLLIGFIAWLAAYIGNIKKERLYLTIIATVITIIVFSIPHSLYGSELDRETGNVIQGFIVSFF